MFYAAYADDAMRRRLEAPRDMPPLCRHAVCAAAFVCHYAFLTRRLPPCRLSLPCYADATPMPPLRRCLFRADCAAAIIYATP